MRRICNLTIVIATLNRPVDLGMTLQYWRYGTCLPAEIRVVDASDDSRTELLCKQDWAPLVVTYLRSPFKSAAQQRNLGAAGCATELIMFCDDDIEVPPDTLERLVEVFEQDRNKCIGGVAATIAGSFHKPPGHLLQLYYRILSGYAHQTYGGKFFGPAINLFPTDQKTDPELYSSQWLNSGLVVYRTNLFARECFPTFSGYSFQEDVNLSVRIARTHRLYFHRGVRYVHKGSPGTHKTDHQRIAMMQMANRWYNASELLGLHGFERSWKFALSQVISSVWLLRSRSPGWWRRLLGGWWAWWQLAVCRRDIQQLMSDTMSHRG